MPSDRKKLRGTILSEDRRTERFFRSVLVYLGFDRKRLTFVTAPSGEGDASRWVRSQYPREVNLLRRKNYQTGLFLIAVRDGDSAGLAKRKADLDIALSEQGLAPREDNERIATPVPTWSIETWLLALVGHEDLDETATLKQEFERLYRDRDRETQAILEAAQAWQLRAEQIPSVPSLADSKPEIYRIDRD